MYGMWSWRCPAARSLRLRCCRAGGCTVLGWAAGGGHSSPPRRPFFFFCVWACSWRGVRRVGVHRLRRARPAAGDGRCRGRPRFTVVLAGVRRVGVSRMGRPRRAAPASRLAAGGGRRALPLPPRLLWAYWQGGAWGGGRPAEPAAADAPAARPPRRAASRAGLGRGRAGRPPPAPARERQYKNKSGTSDTPLPVPPPPPAASPPCEHTRPARHSPPLTQLFPQSSPLPSQCGRQSGCATTHPAQAVHVYMRSIEAVRGSEKGRGPPSAREANSVSNDAVLALNGRPDG